MQVRQRGWVQERRAGAGLLRAKIPVGKVAAITGHVPLSCACNLLSSYFF
jgi:hypothetical protein